MEREGRAEGDEGKRPRLTGSGLVSKQVGLGPRGEELLGLLYRFGGLTVEQYQLLSPERDSQARIDGFKSRGNPWGRRLSSRAEEVRRMVEEGLEYREIARRVGVDADSLRRFVERRGFGRGVR